jgi:hypothetical protein
MTTTVYYNFPEITLNLAASGKTNPSSQKIQLRQTGQPTTNIQLNEINYSAVAIYVAGDDHNPKYLIIECFADVNDTTNSSKIYIAVPLNVIADEKKPKSDVDNIINSTGGAVKLTVNNYIKTDANCIVNQSKEYPVTIILKDDSAILVHNTLPDNFYKLSSFPDLNIDATQEPNGKMHQKDLDWIMSCELLTEDGPEEKQLIDPGATAATITMFLMSIMIAGITYLFAPIVYKELIYTMVINKLNQNHYSLNVYFFITLMLMAFLCFGQGMATKSSIFYFFTIGIILSFFSGTTAVLKLDDISNERGNWFKIYKDSFHVFKTFIASECSTLEYWKAVLLKIFIAFLYFSALSGMSAAIAIKSNTAFIVSFITFFIVSLLPLIFIAWFT